MKPQTICTLALFACLLPFVCGCGAPTRPPGKTSAVSGSFHIDGKPFGPAILTFAPVTDSTAPGIEAHADANGKFDSLVYPDGKDPAGIYNVVVSSDPTDMSMTGVPSLKPFSISVTVPAKGAFPLDIRMESNGTAINSGGPDPGDDGEGDSTMESADTEV